MAKTKDDLSDLIGDGKGKKSKGKKAKDKKPAKKAEKKSAKKVEKKSKGKRADRGEGDKYYPKGKGTQREKLAAGILKRLKKPTSVRDFAKAHNIEGWKVRFAANDLRDDGKIKFKKSEGSSVVMVPK